MTRRVRIVRIATRLNTGGPTVCLAALCRGLDPERYEQWLIAGREGPGERSMVPFVESKDIQPVLVSHMVGRARVGLSDLAAIAQVRRLIHDFKPDIVETHMSKAGVVGRLAAYLEGTAIVLHVYHGHVLAGYFGPLKSWAARRT